MKNILLMVSVGAITFSSVYAIAGSDINKVKISNKSLNVNTINAAIGSGSTANVGSVNIKGSKLSNMKVTNKSLNVGTINAAIGGGTANSGSVNIK